MQDLEDIAILANPVNEYDSIAKDSFAFITKYASDSRISVLAHILTLSDLKDTERITATCAFFKEQLKSAKGLKKVLVERINFKSDAKGILYILAEMEFDTSEWIDLIQHNLTKAFDRLSLFDILKTAHLYDKEVEGKHFADWMEAMILEKSEDNGSDLIDLGLYLLQMGYNNMQKFLEDKDSRVLLWIIDEAGNKGFMNQQAFVQVMIERPADHRITIEDARKIINGPVAVELTVEEMADLGVKSSSFGTIFPNFLKRKDDRTLLKVAVIDVDILPDIEFGPFFMKYAKVLRSHPLLLKMIIGNFRRYSRANDHFFMSIQDANIDYRID